MCTWRYTTERSCVCLCSHTIGTDVRFRTTRRTSRQTATGAKVSPLLSATFGRAFRWRTLKTRAVPPTSRFRTIDCDRARPLCFVLFWIAHAQVAHALGADCLLPRGIGGAHGARANPAAAARGAPAANDPTQTPPTEMLAGCSWALCFGKNEVRINKTPAVQGGIRPRDGGPAAARYGAGDGAQCGTLAVRCSDCRLPAELSQPAGAPQRARVPRAVWQRLLSVRRGANRRTLPRPLVRSAVRAHEPERREG